MSILIAGNLKIYSTAATVAKLDRLEISFLGDSFKQLYDILQTKQLQFVAQYLQSYA